MGEAPKEAKFEVRRTVVKKDSAEVSDEVDDEEDGAFLRTHSQVRTACVALHGMSFRSLNEEVVDFARRSGDFVGGVGCEGEGEDDDNNDDGVDVVSEEGGLDAAEERVEHHANGEQEASCCGWDAREIRSNCRAPGQEHGRYQDVGHEREGHVYEMRGDAVAGFDDFKEGVGVGGLALELDGERCE